MFHTLLGLEKLVTNVNLPNRGQIANLPLGSVVETNAVFSADSVIPVMAGELPESICEKVSVVSRENDRAVEAAFSQDLKLCFEVFCESHLPPSVSLIGAIPGIISPTLFFALSKKNFAASLSKWFGSIQPNNEVPPIGHITILFLISTFPTFHGVNNA